MFNNSVQIVTCHKQLLLYNVKYEHARCPNTIRLHRPRSAEDNGSIPVFQTKQLTMTARHLFDPAPGDTSFGPCTVDVDQLDSTDTVVRSKSFQSDDEILKNPPELSLCSSDGHDEGVSSGEQSTINGFGGHPCDETKENGDGERKASIRISRMSNRNKCTLFMLALENVAAGCTFSLPAPFFPREARIKGVPSTLIGLVMSCFQLVNFVACPLFGNFLSQIGVKFTYVSGIMIAGACAILFGFLDKNPPGTSFVVMSFLVRSVEALGVAAFSTANIAIVANEFPDKVGSVFATLETCVGIGLMIGPAMGAALYEVGGFGLPFWTIGAFMCCSGLAIMTCLPLPRDTKTPNDGSVLSLLRSKMVWVSCASIFACSYGIIYLELTLSAHLDQFGLSPLEVGMFFIIAPGIYATLAPFWGFMSDKKDVQSALLIIGNLLCAMSFLCIGPTPILPFLPRAIWVVTVGLVFFGLGMGLSLVPTMSCLVIGARELGFPDGLSTFGMVSGLFNATFCLGAFFGPTSGGALVDKIGFEYGSTVISGFYLLVIIVTCVYFGLRNRKNKCNTENSAKRYSQTIPLLVLDKMVKKPRPSSESSWTSLSRR